MIEMAEIWGKTTWFDAKKQSARKRNACNPVTLFDENG